MILGWTEGKHAQVDFSGWSAWIGLSLDRWMFGVVFNRGDRTLGFGLGPVYFGAGR